MGFVCDWQGLVLVLYAVWKKADFDLFLPGGFYIPCLDRGDGVVLAPNMQGSSANVTSGQPTRQGAGQAPAIVDAGVAVGGAGVGAGL